ncbi:MAG: DUF4398 domain-containing protein [Polyangiaceae bacterium]|nr:DUF4398 domain-containing protein [Polyangiaceae bacterium]
MRIATIARVLSGAGLASVVTAACGGGGLPPPQTSFEQAQADLGRAEAGGAPSVPDAKLHLQLASEDLNKSKEMVGQDNRRAESLLELSRIEAQLALSLAKAAQAQSGADQAQQEVQKAKSGGAQ